jgi:hypothetical protein
MSDSIELNPLSIILLKNQDVHRNLWNQKIHYHVRKIAPLDTALSQINSIHILPSGLRAASPQTGHTTLSSTLYRQLENQAPNTTGINHLYNTLELLMMGIMVPEACWTSNKICNKNLSVASSWHFIPSFYYSCWCKAWKLMLYLHWNIWHLHYLCSHLFSPTNQVAKQQKTAVLSYYNLDGELRL